MHIHKKTMYHNIYKTIEDDITRFIELEVSLPFEITKENLIGTHETIAESLLSHKAVSHAPCRDAIRNKQLQRIIDLQTNETIKLELDKKK